MKKIKVFVFTVLFLSLLISHIHATQYQHHLASYRDPFSTQTRSICVKWAYPWPGSKICVGWKPQAKYLETKVRLIVSAPNSIEDIRTRIHKALRTAASAAALAGIVTTVSTGQISVGIETAKGVLIPALKLSLPATFALSVDSKQEWTGWQ